MIEILFRGKCIDEGNCIETRDWVEGFYLNLVDYMGNESHRIYTKCSYDFYPESFEVDPETVCQYTGLTDKDETKIFESDIVEVPMINWNGYKNLTARGVVEYKNAAFHVTWFEEMYGRHFIGYLEDVEVIGNKFDNPELIP